MGRRLFLAFFGGPDVGPRLGGVSMDRDIESAYFNAVHNLGGMTAQRVQREFRYTRKELLFVPQGRMTDYEWREQKRLARRAPNEIVTLVREGRAVSPYISSNTFVSAAVSVEAAVNLSLTFARPGDKIGEIMFTDHGNPGFMTFGTDAFVESSLDAGSPLAQALQRLRPYVDDQTVLTLGGCEVGAGSKGQRLAMAIAGLLDVKVQAFRLVQQISTWGIPIRGVEGPAIMCGPRRCVDAAATPFASTIYDGEGTDGGRAYGNQVPFE